MPLEERNAKIAKDAKTRSKMTADEVPRISSMPRSKCINVEIRDC